MPEQQKVDDVVESTSIIGKKKISKLEKSSTALEKDPDNDADSMDVDDQDGDADSMDVDDQDNAAGIEVDNLKE
jgi:hypothetical protein